MQKNIFFILGAVFLIGVGTYAVTQPSCEGASCEIGSPVAILEESASGAATEGALAPSELQTPEVSTLSPASAPEQLLAVAGSYEAYAPEKLARAEQGDVVLFFHASWCPSCRGLNTDIEASRSDIPDGLTILKLDYDKETALKKKYGVTYQHTLVQVDKDGNLIKKWSGGGTLETIVSQVK